eukprot:5554715-Pyramimonas_sp.AAC.1
MLNEAWLRTLRQVANKCRSQSTRHRTDASVLKAFQLHPTDLHLSVLRLRSPFKVLGARPQVLVALLLSITRFSEQLACDLTWAREASPALRGLPDPCLDPQPWLALIGDPTCWAHALSQVEPRFFRLGPKAPTPDFYDARVADPPESAPWPCMLCPPQRRRCCVSEAALRSQQHKSHGRTNPVQQYVASARCPACKKLSTSRAAAIDLVACRSKACRAMLASLAPLSPWAIQELDEADRQRPPEVG